jgi:hypothetical protein
MVAIAPTMPDLASWFLLSLLLRLDMVARVPHVHPRLARLTAWSTQDPAGIFDGEVVAILFVPTRAPDPGAGAALPMLAFGAHATLTAFPTLLTRVSGVASTAVRVALGTDGNT